MAAAACNCVAGPGPTSRTAALRATFLSVAPLVGGLLSSSCCVVQLAINALGLGCAGFAVLTPFEGSFRALTFVALGALLWREGASKRSLLTTALALALMGSQEAVRRANLAPGGGLAFWAAAPRMRAIRPRPAASALAQPAGDEAAPAAAAAAAATVAAASAAQGGGPGSCGGDMGCRDQGSACGGGACAAGPQGKPTAPDDDGFAPSAAGAVATAAAAPTRVPPPSAAAAAAAAAAAPAAAAAAGQQGKPAHARFHVQGIKCEGCAARLKADLLAQPGVEQCSVDFASGAVAVWGRRGALVAADVRAAIRAHDLSYMVTLLESSEGSA